MNKTMQSVFLLLLFFFSVSVMSACLDEGDNVTLTGVLKKETAYGPPSWGEHPQNDEKMNYWFLYPDRIPECFNAVDDDTRHYSKKMQIIMVDEQYSKYRMFLEKDVKLSGKIMFANSPYHSTPVLIFHVSGVELMKGGDN
ncbi:DUF4431 domain-containing protein [Salmonella enterica]|nr:hypothetical protein CHD23_17875 [Salmonella enterica]EDR6672001.1 DUF4431 domain-containing protein [Salmonella enterica subsp. enterica]EDX6230372.1 DUF4431 domain-containing protein [Salmonella enterica subsp. houtenae]EAO9631628.1 DUF4431 domain-containing protein [Salmonella enterica]EAU0255272.1 DUF4431 domain-containing protein [Salmonella enterica]